MRPLRPMMSALCSTAASKIFSQGHITPVSITCGSHGMQEKGGIGGWCTGRQALAQQVNSSLLILHMFHLSYNKPLSNSALCAHPSSGPASHCRTLKLLQPSTTPTMFLPMSCTSPLTVAMMITPALSSPVAPDSRFSSSMKGTKCATARFITRADLITCVPGTAAILKGAFFRFAG